MHGYHCQPSLAGWNPGAGLLEIGSGGNAMKRPFRAVWVPPQGRQNGHVHDITSLTPFNQEIRFKPMLAAETKVAGSHSERAPDTESACSWKKIMEPVEPFLHAVTEQFMRQAHDFDPQIVPYAEHALNNGGKHLRPPWSPWRPAVLADPPRRMSRRRLSLR